MHHYFLLFIAFFCSIGCQVSQSSEKLIPYVKTDWQLLFKPEKTGSYINDHTVYRHADGSWHLIGITRRGQANPADEKFFAHGSSKQLITPGGMAERAVICDHGVLAYAPHAVSKDGVCHLIWGPNEIYLETSEDMSNWKHHGIVHRPREQEGAGEYYRDGMILKVGDRYLQYSTGVEKNDGPRKGYGTIELRESKDLKSWTFIGNALSTSDGAPMNPAWGATESPFVVKKGDYYYLFMTYTNSAGSNSYQNTLVFCSKDPTNFGNYDGTDETFHSRIATHAPEIITDPDTGKEYITSCGWKGSAVVQDGAVVIAELGWYEPGNPPSQVAGKKELALDFETMPKGANGITLVEGKDGKAAKFNGESSWIDIPDLYLNNDFTVSAWVKLDAGIDATDGLIGQVGEGQDINFHDRRVRIYAPGDVIAGQSAIEPGVWTHIVLVRSEQHKLRLYINGKLDAESWWVGCFMPKAIGRGNQGIAFKGLIDELEIYSKAIIPEGAEIK